MYHSTNTTDEETDFLLQIPPEWVEAEEDWENTPCKNILIKCLKMQKRNLVCELLRFVPDNILNKWINELALRGGYFDDERSSEPEPVGN